jgi:hypothetical protein
MSALRKLCKTRTDGSSLQGAGAGTAASFAILFGRNKTVLSAATQDVVEVALYASLSNVLGVSQSTGSTVLEKMRLLSRAIIEGRRNSMCRGVSWSRGLRQERKSKGDDRGRSPRVILDKKSFYMCLHVTLAIV